LFRGRVERAVKAGTYDAIIPSIEGWARMTGYNTIFIDDLAIHSRMGFR
jgi:4-hydroxyproline epimerase